MEVLFIRGYSVTFWERKIGLLKLGKKGKQNEKIKNSRLTFIPHFLIAIETPLEDPS